MTAPDVSKIVFRRRSQKSVLRPIDHIDRFSDLLLDARLTVGDETTDVDGPALYLTPVDLRSAPITLQLSFSRRGKNDAEPHTRKTFEDDLALLGLGIDDVNLVVLGQTSFLKLERELHRSSVSLSTGPALFGEPMTLELARTGVMDRADVLQAVAHGFDIHVMVVLAEQRERMIRRAWRKGTILDRRSFRVRPYSTGEFVPEPLTDEMRESWSLPKETLQYIKVVSPPWTVTRMDECVTAFVDADLLTFLDGNSATQKASQDDLARDVITEVLSEVRSSPDRPPEWDAEFKDTILGSLLRLIDPGTRKSPMYSDADLYSILIGDWPRVRALIDSCTKAKKNATFRLRGDQS